MSFDLAQALGAALDGGCSLAELETTLLAGADSDDQIAAAWLYAWAYDAICPTRVELAARTRVTGSCVSNVTDRRPAARANCGVCKGGWQCQIPAKLT